MNTAIAPIAATTSLSILLHGAVVAVLLTVHSQIALDEAVGRGVEIELVSSITPSDQHETDVPRKQQLRLSQQETMLENVNNTVHSETQKQSQNLHTKVIASLNSAEVVGVTELADKNLVEQPFGVEQEQMSTFEGESVVPVMQSTNTSQQHHSILELLHARIGENKKYPYIARRQRREGIATVRFVLHPDGSIKNTHLVISSRAGVLDRAALSAVKKIEPFTVAQDYLEHAEEFQVDVVFNLL